MRNIEGNEKLFPFLSTSMLDVSAAADSMFDVQNTKRLHRYISKPIKMIASPHPRAQCFNKELREPDDLGENAES